MGWSDRFINISLFAGNWRYLPNAQIWGECKRPPSMDRVRPNDNKRVRYAARRYRRCNCGNKKWKPASKGGVTRLLRRKMREEALHWVSAGSGAEVRTAKYRMNAERGKSPVGPKSSGVDGQMRKEPTL